MKRTLTVFISIIISLSLIGCSKPDRDGIVLEVTENQILLAEELSPEEYEKIKDKPASEIQNEDVLGDAYYGLIYLTYDNAEKFSKGDEVEVWIDGDIMESYPAQAEAKKIEHKK